MLRCFTNSNNHNIIQRVTGSTTNATTTIAAAFPLVSQAGIKNKVPPASTSSRRGRQQQMTSSSSSSIEKQRQEMLRQQQMEEESRAFDLRVHQEEMSAYRQHELETTLELVEEDENAVKSMISYAKAQRLREMKEDGIEDEELLNDEPEGLPFIPSPAPDTLMVQFCDHMQHDQGVKRHAVTVTFGSDGFRLANMCKEIRRDLKSQLATSYWQMNQTQERSAFFVCTRISHGTADLLITSMTQRVINYVEKFGYRLDSNTVTLSPDVQHTSVRMLYHYFIFRRTDESKLLEAKMREEERMEAMDDLNNKNNDEGEIDGDADDENVDNNDEEYVKGQPEFKNYEAPKVGPQEPSAPAKKVGKNQRVVEKIWRK